MDNDPVKAAVNMQAFLSGLNLSEKEQAKVAKPLAIITIPMPNPGTFQFELKAAHRDTARTLHKILKSPTPSPYAGKIDADACHNFIDN
jgi:hypothetical protein